MSIFEPILARLNEQGGRYVVVGGLASIPHQIHMKKLAGRSQDRDDVAKLEEIQRQKGRLSGD